MTSKELERLEYLGLQCAAMLANKDLQSLTVFRGDMRAIVAAYKHIGQIRQKARAMAVAYRQELEEATTLDAVDPVGPAARRSPSTREKRS